jgi:hypothetical protein
MKALLREFAPTVIFAIIVIALLTTTLSNLNGHINREGIQNEKVVGQIKLVNYRLDKLEAILCPPKITALPLTGGNDGG